MDKAQLLTNDIAARHQLFGDICLEAALSYKDEHYTAALACLFVLIEASLKYAIEDNPDDRWGLDMSISEAKKKNFITKEEAKDLRFLQQVRNILFHRDSYSHVVEYKGVAYLFAEPDTKKLLYETLWQLVFTVTKNIVTK